VRLSGNYQHNLTPDELFGSLMQTSEERFQQRLLGMFGQDCATALEWLVSWLEDVKDTIENFIELVHKVFVSQTSRDRPLSAAARAAVTLATPWLGLITAATVTVILRA